MSALPFISPDLELSTRLLKILTLIKNLSFNKAGNPVLSIEKLAIYEFLLGHVYILHSILKASGKKVSFAIRPEELVSINKEYPNTKGLYSYNELRDILQILLIYKLIEVSLSKESEPVYYISGGGLIFLDDFSTEYYDRLDELCKGLLQLQGESFRKILALIKPYIYGK